MQGWKTPPKAFFSKAMENIKLLYDEIHSCRICPNMDTIKAPRRHEVIDENMDVFIVSQALAEKTLRKSGVNFFTEEGELGKTGQQLEKFLEQFNRTVYPPRQIRLSSGKIVRKADSSRISVYNSEITQCYPGPGRKGDRVPNDEEVSNCLGQNFLKQEIAIIKPKLIFLMGSFSRKEFYKHFDGTTVTGELEQQLNSIVESRNVPTFTIEKVPVFVLPICHPAAHGGRFSKMCTKNWPLISLIKGLLART